MNNNASNSPNSNVNTIKLKNRETRACLISHIPRKHHEQMDIACAFGSMSNFIAQNKDLEVVHDFGLAKGLHLNAYQTNNPLCVDPNKLIQRMKEMRCGVLIVPTFRTLADKPEICSDIMLVLHEANIRIISPYDDFDSKQVYDLATAGSMDLFRDLRNALLRAITRCVTKNVDEFIDYVEHTRNNLYKNAPFVLAFGNKAIQIPYSEDICEEIFDFIDILDEKYLRPELFTDDESDDEDEDKDEAPPMYIVREEPRVERDFEG